MTRGLFNPLVSYEEFLAKHYATMTQIIHSGGLEHPLAAFETGARVWKPGASRFDFAYMRIGRVVRQDGKVGVRYVGSDCVMEYSEDDVFSYVSCE